MLMGIHTCHVSDLSYLSLTLYNGRCVKCVNMACSGRVYLLVLLNEAALTTIIFPAVFAGRLSVAEFSV